MPYPESCPECGGAFRNTGTHFTARRNEVGRHVLLELGCQNTSRRFWWDFTSGHATADGQSVSAKRETLSPAVVAVASSANGTPHAANGSFQTATPPTELIVTNGHAMLSMLDLDRVAQGLNETQEPDVEIADATAADAADPMLAASQPLGDDEPVELPGAVPGAPAPLKEAFVRQLQLDRLTLRQMRSWLMADEARRAIEVAAGATEATYERLALILFGTDLPQLLGKQVAVQPTAGLSAEERLELQREKARIRARLRRAAAKAAKLQGTSN